MPVYSINEVIIAIPSAKAGALGKIVSAVMKADPRINIHILPEVEKFFDTVPLTPSLEDISFADIIDRDEYTVDIGSMKSKFSGKTVMISILIIQFLTKINNTYGYDPKSLR